jgi:cytochrome c-type biogenesis protein CcsB
MIIPITFFIVIFASLILPAPMQKISPLVPSLQSNWLMMHVSMMMISYATLIVGSLLSILYLAFSFINKKNLQNNFGNKNQNQKIQSQTPNFINLNALIINTPVAQTKSLENSELSKLSLLQTIDIWSYRIIGLGFPFLTTGIISGAVWANEAWGSYWSWDPKETWALITWLVFAIYLHSRLLKGWQGKNAAVLGSCGFFVIWICYLGVNFLGKGLHSYGWVL